MAVIEEMCDFEDLGTLGDFVYIGVVRVAVTLHSPNE